MELLFDSDGKVVVKDGMPVYKYPDGKEIPFDAPAAVTNIGDLNNEAKGHRLTAKETATKLAVFDGIDPVKAKEALSTVENLDMKKLVDAGQVDAIKQQMIDNFSVKEKQIVDNFNTTITEKDTNLQRANDHIFRMTVESEFLKSPLFNGKDQKTSMTSDVAYAVFNNHFTIDSTGDAPRIVATLNGEEILSRERAGKPADFHEAMDRIWEEYPSRTRYETQDNGGGGTGNHDRDNNQTYGKPMDRIAAGLRQDMGKR